MTDTAIALHCTIAGASGAAQVLASAPLFGATDVGRLISIRNQAPERVANATYAIGNVFCANYAGVYRVYRVTAAGTTPAFATSNTVPAYDINAPRDIGDSIVDGSCLLLYLGSGKMAFGWGTITAVIDPQAVDVTVDPTGPFAATTPSLRWRLGEWSDARGWPSACSFFQQRLVLAGSAVKPQTVWFSTSGDFENYQPQEPDGTVLDTEAITITIDDDQVNTALWMSTLPRGLVYGAPGAEFLLGPASITNIAISPTNIRSQREGDRGSAAIAGIRVAGVVLFVQRGAQILRQLEYNFATDAFTTADLTQLADDIAGPASADGVENGLLEMAYQQLPNGTLWFVRADGQLASLTYDQEQRVRAWAVHPIGGPGAIAETVCCVPSPDGTYDDLYVGVARVVGGVEQRSIEYLRRPYRQDLDGPPQSFFVDGGLTYAGAPQSSFTGLDHLEGQLVQVCADGSARSDQVVTGGRIGIDGPPASVVHVGYGYVSTLVTLPPEVPGEPTGQGQIKAINEVNLRFLDTRGGKLGSLTEIEWLQMRLQGDAMSQAAPLFTGDHRVQFPGGAQTSGQMQVMQDQPLPMTLLAIEMAVTVDSV